MVRRGEAGACRVMPTQPALVQWQEIPCPKGGATLMPITLLARTGTCREQTCICLQYQPSCPSCGLKSHTQKGVSIHTIASKASRVTLNPLDHLFPNFFLTSHRRYCSRDCCLLITPSRKLTMVNNAFSTNLHNNTLKFKSVYY